MTDVDFSKNPLNYAASGPPYTIEYTFLPDGAQGTFDTLETMAACVRGEVPPDHAGYQLESLRHHAEALVFGAQGATEEIEALLAYVRDSIAYRQHPLNQQRVQDAPRTIQFRSGDCVSKSVLLATLLASLGHAPRFVAQSTGGCEYTHVYVEAYNEDLLQWVALDPCNPSARPGWSQQLPPAGFETTWAIFRE